MCRDEPRDKDEEAPEKNARIHYKVVPGTCESHASPCSGMSPNTTLNTSCGRLPTLRRLYKDAGVGQTSDRLPLTVGRFCFSSARASTRSERFRPARSRRPRRYARNRRQSRSSCCARRRRGRDIRAACASVRECHPSYEFCRSAANADAAAETARTPASAAPTHSWSIARITRTAQRAIAKNADDHGLFLIRPARPWRSAITTRIAATATKTTMASHSGFIDRSCTRFGPAQSLSAGRACGNVTRRRVSPPAARQRLCRRGWTGSRRRRRPRPRTPSEQPPEPPGRYTGHPLLSIRVARPRS
jgi:hypothetical protein